jgi:DNA-binding transcriptional LysR family regulator
LHGELETHHASHRPELFLSVVRTLNFARAADECDLAQPSLSRAIK